MNRRKAKVMIALLAFSGILGVVVLDQKLTAITTFDSETAEITSGKARIVPRVESFVLRNGLEVVALPITNAKKTVLMVWYRVGAADDPPDKLGLAHYSEHVTFSALGSHNSTDDSDRVRRPSDTKPQPEAFTFYDYTAYYHIISKQRLDAAMRLEADRMARLQIDEAAVKAELQAVIDEREHDVDGDPLALLEARLRAALFGAGPYGRPIVGGAEDTALVSSVDVRTFLDRWYSPRSAILIVAGALDVDTLRRTVEEHFGQIIGARVPKRERPNASRHSERRVRLQSNRSPQTLWARSCLAPSFGTADRREIVSVQLLARILATFDGGRLRRALVKDRQFAEGVVVEYEPSAVGDTVFTIHATLAQNGNLSEFEAGIESELSDLVSRGLSSEEVTEARNAALAEYARVWRDPFDVASMFGAQLTTGGTLADMDKWPELISSIKPQDIRAAAQRLFAADNCATGTLGVSGE